MKLYNSLSRQIETFEPFEKERVGVYTCGPTVYDYVTIGNWRTYTLGDVLVRTLEFLGYQVDYIMNITDVGHLTGDNLGDADTGEDRMEKASKREGKTAWEIAEFYTQDFYNGYQRLNLSQPKVWCKATEHIEDQIRLVQDLEKKNLVYRIRDGMYFDVGEYEHQGNQYGALSTLDKIQAGARVEFNEQKRDERDFALWKFSPVLKSEKEKRQMEWESPWGVGFPGWHLECSAMSMKYLGEQFDLHVGGEDLRSTHHPNEIAQSEGATGRHPFVKYWLHGAFLTVDGGRMGKSKGNAYTLNDLENKGFSAMDLRYFYFTGHYRKPLNFTFEALSSAQQARNKLTRAVMDLEPGEWGEYSDEGKRMILDFEKALTLDFNMPEVLAVVWEVVRSKKIESAEKVKMLQTMERVLGLGLFDIVGDVLVPDEVETMARLRLTARNEGKYERADALRLDIEMRGFEVEDTSSGYRLRKKGSVS